MNNYLSGSLVTQLKEILDLRFKINQNEVKQSVSEELRKVYGEHSVFELPFSNESLAENKIVFGTIIKPK